MRLVLTVYKNLNSSINFKQTNVMTQIPDSKCSLDESGQTRDGKDGSDELALGDQVVLDAEGLCQQEGDRKGCSKHGQVMLKTGTQRKKVQGRRAKD